MAEARDERALIEAYFDVIRDGDVDRLAEVVADDYRDHNPMKGQWVGRFGVMQKLLAFRAEHPGAAIAIESIEVGEGTARATWTTTAPNLDGTPAITTWRYVGEFEFGGGRIRSSKVERTGKVA